jgi:hypothetical protein
MLDVIPRSLIKVHWNSRVPYCLCLQGQRVNQETSKKQMVSTDAYFWLVSWLAYSFNQNVSKILLDYSVIVLYCLSILSANIICSSICKVIATRHWNKIQVNSNGHNHSYNITDKMNGKTAVKCIQGPIPKVKWWWKNCGRDLKIYVSGWNTQEVCKLQHRKKANNVNTYVGISLSWMLGTIPTQIITYDRYSCRKCNI